MRHAFLLTVASCLALFCTVGCTTQETKVKKETTVETPKGKTTTTTETKIETSGENPPPAAKP
jgi:hypothetical protein